MSWPGIENIKWFWSGSRAFHVPYDQFSRYDGKRKICRNVACQNSPRPPLREYCSEDCKAIFKSWIIGVYNQYFSWDAVQQDVWKRDRGRCTKCHKKVQRDIPHRSDSAEFDHIIPLIIAQERLKISPTTLQFVTEILHNRKNVRLMCHDCHAVETAKLMSGRLSSKPSDIELMALHDKAMRRFRIIFGDKTAEIPPGQMYISAFCMEAA